MPVTIRPATAADADPIKAMIKAEGLDPTSLKWENFLIAELDGKTVGFGQLRQHPGCQELGSLVTLRQYRGQGIASQLMTALEARAGRPLYLLCPQHRESFYLEHGYVVAKWIELPAFLKFKGALAMLLRLIGMRVLVMQKT